MAASSVRPNRQWLQKVRALLLPCFTKRLVLMVVSGCCTKRSILRDAGTLVQCQMIATNQTWNWQKTCEVRDVWKITSGYGTELLLTANEQLIRAGDLQQVEYEQVCLRKRKHKRSSTHGSAQLFKSLPPRDENMILEANCPYNRTSCVPISLPTCHRVRQIACGLSHCVVIAESDTGLLSLLTMGHGIYGQLGLAEVVHAPSLVPVASSSELLLEMLAVSSNDETALRCGPFTTSLLIRNTSSVWIWGLLPCADSPNRLTVQDRPTIFPWVDSGVRVADIAIGMEHLTLLSTSGSVFTWGNGYAGQLGLELAVGENAQRNAEQVQFYCANMTVESISSGWYHNLAVSTDGRVFAWGSNRYGACGARTKFIEYFHPVLVALPPNLRNDQSSKWSVHCCGHTSSLLVKSRYGVVERTLVWGICSSKYATLLPVEAGGLASCHQDFVHAQAGFGCIRWIVQHHEAVAPLFQLVAGHSPPLVKAIRTFCCNFEETVMLPLKLVPGFETNEPLGLDKEVVIISLLAANGSQQTEKLYYSICAAKDEETSDSADLVVEIGSMCEGNYCVRIAINGLFVLGFPICLKVTGKSPNANVTSKSSADPIEIIGMSVISRSLAEKSSLVDLRWFGMKSRRLRLTCADELVILARGVRTNCYVRLECDDHSRIVPFVLPTSKSQVALAVVGFPIPASYKVTFNSKDSPTDQRILLHVDCCMSELELRSVVLAHKRLVDRYFTAASSMKSPDSAKFALFLSSMLNHDALRFAIARSPWIRLDPEADFDFDRFACEQQILKTSADPFTLWNQLLQRKIGKHRDHLLEKDTLAASHGCKLDELMPTWLTTIGNICYAPFKTLVIEDAPGIALSDTAIEPTIESPQDAHEGLEISRHVSQSPYEFLLQTSSTLAIAQTGDLRNNTSFDIHSWLDHKGDLHYTPKRRDHLIEVYIDGNGSASATSVKGNPVALWKRQLHSVLWSLIEARDVSIAGLFRFLATAELSADSNVPPTTITYQNFVRQAQALGFGSSLAKQQWYALFVNIQSMSLTNRSTIPLHVFRTFVIDPFHEIFWKQYLHRIKSLFVSFESCMQLILQHLGPWTPSSDEQKRCIPWKDFITRLSAFNNALATSRCTSDYNSGGVSDYCRLLYRFDVHCNGMISVDLVMETMISDLKMLFEQAPVPPAKLRASKRKSAVTSKWRPDIETFTTTEAVRKLFVARSEKQQEQVLRDNKSDTVLELMSSGNTRLARIRSLPVSRMIREGTYFRSQQKYEGALIADHSF